MRVLVAGGASPWHDVAVYGSGAEPGCTGAGLFHMYKVFSVAKFGVSYFDDVAGLFGVLSIFLCSGFGLV